MNEDLQKQIEEAKASLPKEEIKTEESKTDETEAIVSQETQDPYLDEALKSGYDPNYKGPNKKTPEQFVKDGSFFKKIDAQNKKIEELLGVVKNLDEHNRKIAESSYNKGVRDALEKRKAAVESGDVLEFNKAEEELQNLQKIKPTAPAANPQGNVVTQDMLDFVEENKSWFNHNSSENKDLVTECDWLFSKELTKHPDKSHKEILQTVKQQLTLLHPEKFSNPNKEKAPVVSKSSMSSSSSKSGLAARLTERQVKFYNTAKSSGVSLTLEEYAKQLDMTGDLKNE
jgi:hypothetical protein